jgi:hypothetical protein
VVKLQAASFKLQANSKHNFYLVLIGEARRCSLLAARYAQIGHTINRSTIFLKKPQAASIKLQANSKHNFHLVLIGKKPGAVRCTLFAFRRS